MIRITILLLFGLLASCATSNTSMIVGDSYDKETDRTTLILLPYGGISMPGKWTKTRYNQVSKQYFFVDKDSTLIAVTKNAQNIYPFYSKTMTDIEFTKKFYQWESDYFIEQGLQVEQQIFEDKLSYIVWTAKGQDANTMFLYGAKNKLAYNLAVYSDNWTDDKRKDFLISLFKEN